MNIGILSNYILPRNITNAYKCFNVFNLNIHKYNVIHMDDIIGRKEIIQECMFKLNLIDMYLENVDHLITCERGLVVLEHVNHKKIRACVQFIVMMKNKHNLITQTVNICDPQIIIFDNLLHYANNRDNRDNIKNIISTLDEYYLTNKVETLDITKNIISCLNQFNDEK